MGKRTKTREENRQLYEEAKALVDEGTSVKEACEKVGLSPSTWNYIRKEKNKAPAETRVVVHAQPRAVASGKRKAQQVVPKNELVIVTTVSNLRAVLGVLQ